MSDLFKQIADDMFRGIDLKPKRAVEGEGHTDPNTPPVNLTHQEDDSVCVQENLFGFNSALLTDEVDAILKPILATPHERLSWTDREKVLYLAKVAFGEKPKKWFTDNSMASTSRRKMDFLLDTVRFIQTGKRQMSVQNWRDLLPTLDDPVSVKPEDRVDVNADKYYKDLVIYMKVCNTVDMLCHWCSQPKGFQDLVCTLDILFGSTQPRKIEPQRATERLTFRIV